MKGGAIVVLLVAVAMMVVVVSVSRVEGHSWVACADYRITNEQDSYYYNDKACFGYPRNFKEFDRGFGVDAGYDYQISANADTPNSCPTRAPRTNPITASYTDRYPMAKYTPGQQVCMAWPTKNHVAAPCTNQYIPDGGVKIFMSPVNPSNDPTQSQFETNLLAELPKHETNTIDFKGYQNCSKFCENMDKSLCVGCFDLPANIQQGYYTLQWYWIFNTGQAYTTCMDVQIGAATTTGTGTGGGSTTTGGATTGGGSTTGGAASPPPLARDDISVVKVPSIFSPKGSFTVTVKYNAAGARQLVVDILSVPDFSWYGKGAVSVVQGTGQVEISVTPQNDPPKYKNYIIKTWLVDKKDYDANPAEAYAYELTRSDSPATCGDTSVYVFDGSVETDDGGSKGTKGWLLAVLFFTGMIVAAIIFGVVVIIARSRSSNPNDYRLFGKNTV